MNMYPHKVVSASFAFPYEFLGIILWGGCTVKQHRVGWFKAQKNLSIVWAGVFGFLTTAVFSAVAPLKINKAYLYSFIDSAKIYTKCLCSARPWGTGGTVMNRTMSLPLWSLQSGGKQTPNTSPHLQGVINALSNSTAMWAVWRGTCFLLEEVRASLRNYNGLWEHF